MKNRGGRHQEHRWGKERGDHEWREGFGSYGVGGYGEPSERDVPRTGYGEQGFGAGESRGGRWGGGERGGYGGGEPGGLHGTRGGGWAAAGERYELGRGPRSYGPEGWGGRPAHGSRTGTRARRPDHAAPEPPWRQSEFAGRGEFGEQPHHRWNEDLHAGRAATDPPLAIDEAWNVPGPHTGRGPKDYRRADAAIREDVCERLTRHGYVDASYLTVQVENGEVRLDGTVDSRAAKRLAEDTAETVSGVRDVHNRLRIERKA